MTWLILAQMIFVMESSNFQSSVTVTEEQEKKNKKKNERRFIKYTCIFPYLYFYSCKSTFPLESFQCMFNILEGAGFFCLLLAQCAIHLGPLVIFIVMFEML